MSRKIWQYWETRGHKPPYVDGLHDLARRNSGVDVIQVSPDSLHHYLSDIPKEIFEIKEMAHKADMIRTMLVREHGGMWLDSDAIVLRDLNWLFDLLEQYEFIGFNDGGKLQEQRPWVRVNCFLSRPHGSVIKAWVAAQHQKFPRTTYKWPEIGVELLNPICLDRRDQIKILPFEFICPVRWDEVKKFSSRWRTPRKELDTTFICMLSGKALEKRDDDLQRMTMEQIRNSGTYLSHWVLRAMNPDYQPPPGAMSRLRRLVGKFRNRP